MQIKSFLRETITRGRLNKEIEYIDMHTTSIPSLSGVSSRTVSFSSTAIIRGCNKIHCQLLTVPSEYAMPRLNQKSQNMTIIVFDHTLFFSFFAKAIAASPPQASIGRITLSTSLANMQPVSKDGDFVSTYCGALLSPASTHGKNVYPNCRKGVTLTKKGQHINEQKQEVVGLHIHPT